MSSAMNNVKRILWHSNKSIREPLSNGFQLSTQSYANPPPRGSPRRSRARHFSAVVHEAYPRLASDEAMNWNSRGPYSAATARSIQRVLTENARRKKTLKAGGEHQRVSFSEVATGIEGPHFGALGL